MNILYCGDRNIRDGVLVSILSLMEQTHEPLHIYVLTMELEYGLKRYEALSDQDTKVLDQTVKEAGEDNFVRCIDLSEAFRREMPKANMETRFTPGCMLRLFADEVDKIPDRILYLDNDVVCRQNPEEFYHQDLTDMEFAGVLDYYGSWFFRENWLKRDYINSGVLLLNMKEIRKTGLFRKCRERCRDEEMFMPDQSAINKLAVSKKIVPRKYNEQRKLRKDTVFQHFTTSFRFFPWLHTLTVKPWDVDRMHEVLKLHEYDEVLERYEALKPAFESSYTESE